MRPVTEGWQPDPSGRHQQRWHDGAHWSSAVRDHGVTNDDAAGVPGGIAAAGTGRKIGGPTPPSRATRTGEARFGIISGATPPVDRNPSGPSSSPVGERVFMASTAKPPMTPSGLLAAPGQNPLAGLGKNSVVSGLVAGALGGGVGMIVAELLKNPSTWSSGSKAAVRTNSGLWVAIIGLVLGALLASWDSITASAWERVPRSAAIGAASGAVAGFIGGYLAQMLYTSMLETAFREASSIDELQSRVYVARGAGWGIFGAILGLGLGLPGGKKKVVNGLIGGSIGGALGGLAFQKLSESATAGDSGASLRFFGMALTGLGIGLGVGLVDRITRQRWIEFRSGPLRGREVILFKPRTSLGAAATCDVVLANDPTMAAVHVTVAVGSAGVVLEPIGPTSVDGVPLGAPRSLRVDEVVELGRTQFVMRERATR